MTSLRLVCFSLILSVSLLGCVSIVVEEGLAPSATSDRASLDLSPTRTEEASSSEPQAATLRQLTTGGCCTQPFFSPDSSRVLFIDKPRDDRPAGVYGVNLSEATDQSLPPVELMYETIGFRSPDFNLVAQPDPANDALMRFTNEVSGTSWTVNTRGYWPFFSPNADQIFWNATDFLGPYDQRQTDLWLANIDGSQGRRLLTVYGGGAEGWFPDGQRLLMTGRPERIGEEESLFVLSIADGSMVELAKENRLHADGISPGGSWVAYFSFFATDPSHDGLFVVRADGSERRKLDFLGAARWRDDSHLVYIPTRASPDDSLVVWEIDVETGESYPLTDPIRLRFVIENGDWALAPDGKKIVFVSEEDKNLWLISLP